MAAAVVPDPTFSALYNDASKWTHPTVDYEYYTECVGALNPVTAATNDRPTTITMLVNLNHNLLGRHTTALVLAGGILNCQVFPQTSSWHYP